MEIIKEIVNKNNWYFECLISLEKKQIEKMKKKEFIIKVNYHRKLKGYEPLSYSCICKNIDKWKSIIYLINLKSGRWWHWKNWGWKGKYFLSDHEFERAKILFERWYTNKVISNRFWVCAWYFYKHKKRLWLK